MPREYRPGAYDRSKNSYNYTTNTSGASSSGNNNHNRSGGHFPNYNDTNRKSSNGNNSNSFSTKRNNTDARINSSGINHPSQGNSQPSTSKNSGGITSCYRKFFVNKRSTTANKQQDEAATTSAAFWKPKATTTVASISRRAASSLTKTSNYFNKLLEIQRKFPLWKPEYRTNIFKVRKTMEKEIFLMVCYTRLAGNGVTVLLVYHCKGK